MVLAINSAPLFVQKWPSPDKHLEPLPSSLKKCPGSRAADHQNLELKRWDPNSRGTCVGVFYETCVGPACVPGLRGQLKPQILTFKSYTLSQERPRQAESQILDPTFYTRGGRPDALMEDGHSLVPQHTGWQ